MDRDVARSLFIFIALWTLAHSAGIALLQYKNDANLLIALGLFDAIGLVFFALWWISGRIFK